MTGPDLRDAPLVAIVEHLRRHADGSDGWVWIRVLDPDVGEGRWPGTRVGSGIHRSWRTWIGLAERLGLRFATPRPDDDGETVWLGFRRLGARARWDAPDGEDERERYGASSDWARLRKAEEPGFVVDLAEALARIELPARPAVLDLGCNRGDEIALLRELDPRLREASFVGVDHSASALEVARARFESTGARFVDADLARPAALDLGPTRFDLVVSIGTLHSPAIDDRAVLRRIVQDWTHPRAAMIFGFPNCRWVDGELEYGARVKNLREPELSLLLQDVAFFRRYLHQHRRRVFVTGKHYVLVTAIPLAGPAGV